MRIFKLKWFIFPSIDQPHLNEVEIANRAIVTPTNKDVKYINDIALGMMGTGNEITLRSVDSVEEDQGFFPVEYLNSLDLLGLPPHELKLKPGDPLVLLRNLDPIRGLCNGTRLIAASISPRVLQVYRSCSDPTRTLIVLPRIDLISKPGILPFTFKRRQFPVRLAFCMTITKAQGRSLDYVGVYLQRPVFSHGQIGQPCGDENIDQQYA